MKIIALAVMLLSTAGVPQVSAESVVLLSISDGWGTHFIPGLGKIPVSDPLQCGKVRVFVYVVENTEMRDSPLLPERVQELRTINAATLRSLAAAGNACPKPPFSAEA
jgi:hypothetical protein